MRKFSVTYCGYRYKLLTNKINKYDLNKLYAIINMSIEEYLSPAVIILRQGTDEDRNLVKETFIKLFY